MSKVKDHNDTDAPLTADQLVIRYATDGTVPTREEEDAAIADRLGVTCLEGVSALLVDHCREVLRRDVGLLPALEDDRPLPQHPVGDTIEIKFHRNATGREAFQARVIPRRPRPGAPASRECLPQVRVRMVRPVARRRGAGAPAARRRRAAATTGGSSDGSGDPAPGDPAADQALEVAVLADEKAGPVAVRLALAIYHAPERGELLLSADEGLHDLLAEALPLTLALLRRKDLHAEGAPRLFEPGWALVIEGVRS